MVNVDLLKDTIIVSRHKTIKEVYEKMGLTKRKFELRMQKKVFDSNEIAQLIEILALSKDEVFAIFFALEVTADVTE